MKCYFVYMLASKRNGTLYVGVTNDVIRRTWEHKKDLVQGFTRKYGVRILVWYELHEDINAAIAREKRLKRWNPGVEDQADREREFRLERFVEETNRRSLLRLIHLGPLPSRDRAYARSRSPGMTSGS